MNSRIVAVIALILLTAVGCGTGTETEQADDPASPAASAPADPSQPESSQPASGQTAATRTAAADPACDAPGRYADYAPAAVADDCYTDTILFFHAPWCPECRGFEEAIKAGTVPDGAQILKVDYDSATDLRKKYAVTIQSTFVRVDTSGERVERWSGYGKDKSVDAILENTK